MEHNLPKGLLTEAQAQKIADPRTSELPMTIENLCEVFAKYRSYELELQTTYNYESYSMNGDPLRGEELAMLPVYRNAQRVVNACKEMIDDLCKSLKIYARISVKTTIGKRIIIESDYGDTEVQMVEDLEDDAV